MIIQSKKVWFADQFVEAQIEVKDGKIVDIYEYGTHPVDCDYGDNRILPGFIDVHCHGAYGFDTNDAKEDGLRYWVRNIVDEGVTALLATTITQSEEVLTNALKNVAKVVEDGYEGAEILGVHFEGPYLDMKYKGAQPEQYIVKPTVEQFKKYQEAANGLINILRWQQRQMMIRIDTLLCGKRGSCEYRTFGGNEQRSGTGICPWRKIDDTCI